MNSKNLIIFLFCFMLINFCFAQNQKLDSLMYAYKNTKNDIEKIKILTNGIGYEYENINLNLSIKYYNEALKLSVKHKEKMYEAKTLQFIGIAYKKKGNFLQAIEYYYKAIDVFKPLCKSGVKSIADDAQNGISACYNNIGNVFLHLSDYEKAIEQYKKSLIISEKNNEKEGMSNSYLNIGIAYVDQGNYKNAIEFFLKSAKIKEETKDKEGLSYCYNNLGELQRELGNPVKALDYYSKSLNIAEEINDKVGISLCCSNIGLIYVMRDQSSIALTYFQKAMKFYIEIDDKEGMAICYDNIGGIFLQQKKYSKAIEMLTKAFELEKKLNIKRGFSITAANIANIYMNMAVDTQINLNEKNKYYKEAEKYALDAFQMAKEINTLPQLAGIADILKDIYSLTGNTKKALEYADIFINVKDSMFKEEKTKAITEMETKYQSEKKQLEIDKLAKEKELQTSEMKKQRLIILFVMSGLFFLAGFSVLLFRMFLQKKKTNIIITEKNVDLQIAYEEINTQKEEIIVQRDNIQEQKEIIEEHQKEIEDSINYAKRIQQAVLPDLSVIVRRCPEPVEGAQPEAVSDDKITSLPLAMTAISTPHNFALFDYFVLFKPKDIVSGDFYWATRINEWLIVTVADCTGHGVPGAFMSMLGISFLNEIIRKKEITKVSDVLNELRTSVIDALKQKGESGEQKDGMDIALCAINIKTLEMQFAGANNPCYIIANTQPVIAMAQPEAISTAQSDCFVPRNDEYNFVDPVIELVEIKGDKMPIGIHTNMQPFTNQIYQLQKGDTIYLMSDGYEDQFGGSRRKKFLSKNLKNLLMANSQKPMAEQKQILETTLKDWIGNNEQIDDITVLGIKI